MPSPLNNDAKLSLLVIPSLPETSSPPVTPEIPHPPSILQKLQNLEKGLRNYGDNPDWNADFSGRTGGKWDILQATDLRSRNRLLNFLLRPVNNATAGAAYTVNAVNNVAGTIFIDGFVKAEETLIGLGGPSFEELAVAAQATPVVFDDLLSGSLVQLKYLSRNLKPRFFPAKIQIHPKALAHIEARHIAPWPEKFPTSLFFPDVDLNRLLVKATKIPRRLQNGGNYERILEASRLIGIDRRSGSPTEIYTVITSPQEKLITIFPGKP